MYTLRLDYYSSGIMFRYTYWTSVWADGEFMVWSKDGILHTHIFVRNGDTIHDQLLYPLSEHELMLLCIEHGFKRLPKLEEKEATP